MKKIETETDDELQPEYDLKKLRVRKVGPDRKRFGKTSIQTREDGEYSSGDSSEDRSDESDPC